MRPSSRIFSWRQPCPWDITLDRVLETEIELEERTKLEHSFVSISACRDRLRRDKSFRRFEKHFSLWPIVTHVINYSSKGFDVLYAAIAYMLDVFISLVYVGLSRKRFSTGISRRRVSIGVVCVLWVERQLFVHACVSIRCIRRKRFQRLVLSCLVCDVLSVNVVSVKLINVVSHVAIVITTPALAKHLSVRTLFFSMSCGWMTSEEDERRKCVSHPMFFRHIKHLGPNRFDIDRLTMPGKVKEQSRSLPRIPLPVKVFVGGFDLPWIENKFSF